jgi:ubiquinone/menaquinone biosynthesis C-methylase UbiE
MKNVLDVSCGGRMFWFNKKKENVVFMDIRIEQVKIKDSSDRRGFQLLDISPNVKGNFTALPFKNDLFDMVVFDPPHLVNNGSRGWLSMRYGRLNNLWQGEIAAGFHECFRVLKSNGTLIFKWNEIDIPASTIISLSPEPPLFGNRCGKQNKTHWIVFSKERKMSL